jgi:hypothetical protein
MAMTRRSVILLGLGVGAGACAAGVGVAWTQRERLKDLSDAEGAAYLRENFDYLRLEVTDEQLRGFVADYRRHHAPLQRALWHRVRGWGEGSYTRQMDQLATTFLLSTDFFLNDADESQPVHYVMFYHPYVSPCWNPLAPASA